MAKKANKSNEIKNNKLVIEAKEWALLEFGEAQLGDQRRTQRLVQVAEHLAREPQGTLPGSFEDDPSGLAAAYRLLDNPHIDPSAIQAPHRQRVAQALQQPGEFLLVEDTSSLDYTGRQVAQDMGSIGDGGGRGIWLHTTLGLQIHGWDDQQRPQVTLRGLWAQQPWMRLEPTHAEQETKAHRLNRPRESQRWAASLTGHPGPSPGSVWTYVADAESDIYEAFQRCDQAHTHFVIRACQPRALYESDQHLFEAVHTSRRLGSLKVPLRARPGQKARTARMQVRAVPVVLKGPWRPGQVLAPQPLWVVEVYEPHPPKGVEPLHWVLLTDWPCPDFAAARRVVRMYEQRWLIEEYHKALKSGTRIEASQLEDPSNLLRLLAIVSLVSVWLVQLKLLARHQPHAPITGEQVGPDILEVLQKRLDLSPAPWTAGTLWRAIATVGGFLGRKGDGDPGWQTIWRGWRKLRLLLEGYRLAKGGS